MANRKKQNPGGVVDGAQNTVPAGARDGQPAGSTSSSTVPPSTPGGGDLLVVGGVAQTRGALLAAHRPDAAGTSCRACGHVYGEVRACPAAAEALEGSAAVVRPGPVEQAGPVEIVHMVCGPRPRRRRSGLWVAVRRLSRRERNRDELEPLV